MTLVLNISNQGIVADYYFSEIKFKLKESGQGYGVYQLIIKEKARPRKKLGKTILAEASAFSKYGFKPLDKENDFHHFFCKKDSSVEITFKSKRNPHKTNVIIDFDKNYIDFLRNQLPSNQNAMSPTLEEIQTIMESIYIGTKQKFTFFISKKKVR